MFEACGEQSSYKVMKINISIDSQNILPKPLKTVNQGMLS